LSFVGFTPDGRWLVTASLRDIRIWRTDDLDMPQSWPTSLEPIDIAFSPDSAWLAHASASRDEIVLSSLATGETRRLAATTEVEAPTVSPDGKRVAAVAWSEGTGMTPRVWWWDVDTGAEQSVVLPDSYVTRVRFLPDGKRLAAMEANYGVKLIDLATGELSDAVKDSGLWYPSWTLAVSNDGKRLAYTREVTIVVSHLSGNEPDVELKGHPLMVMDIEFSPDSKNLASASADSTLRSWNLDSGESQIIRGHRDTLTSVAFFSDGEHVATGSFDRTVRVWDLLSRESYILGRHSGSVRSVAVSPDGRYVASGAKDGKLTVWPLPRGKPKGHDATSVRDWLDAETTAVIGEDDQPVTPLPDDQRDARDPADN